MFLFGGGSKNSKKDKFEEDDLSKSMKQQLRESLEIKDLKKRAKEAQKRRGESMTIES